jgi:hypothetical protein
MSCKLNGNALGANSIIACYRLPKSLDGQVQPRHYWSSNYCGVVQNEQAVLFGTLCDRLQQGELGQDPAAGESHVHETQESAYHAGGTTFGLFRITRDESFEAVETTSPPPRRRAASLRKSIMRPTTKSGPATRPAMCRLAQPVA